MNKENQNDFEICKGKLKKLVNKKELYFTKRCNKSIELAVSLALEKIGMNFTEKESKEKEITKEIFLLVQEEGGWITYKNYAKKHKLTLVKLEMRSGKIINEQIEKAIEKAICDETYGGAILILHSLPGYSYVEDMESLSKIVLELNAKSKKSNNVRSNNAQSNNMQNIILINDCCGSIGTKNATIGDIIVCSFGEAKPLSAGGGGFIAADKFSEFNNSNSNSSSNSITLLLGAEKDAAELIDFQKLKLAIDSLRERLLRWHKKAKLVKNELTKKGFSILNSDKNEKENKGENKEESGINVLVGFCDDSEKERLINYCRENTIEYTECPRYIRTNKKALSLEIKRLNL